MYSKQNEQTNVVKRNDISRLEPLNTLQAPSLTVVSLEILDALVKSTRPEGFGSG